MRLMLETEEAPIKYGQSICAGKTRFTHQSTDALRKSRCACPAQAPRGHINVRVVISKLKMRALGSVDHCVSLMYYDRCRV